MKLLIKFFLGCLFGFVVYSAYCDNNPLSVEKIKERTKPEGTVNIAKPEEVPAPTSASSSSSPTPSDGKKTYDTKCFVCHATGLAGSPKFGDKAAWQPRIKQGMDVLFEHVKNGYNAMPPKGTCVECTDADLHAAIEYMVKQGS